MQKVLIAGVGMTPFTKSPGRGVRDLAITAAREALTDASVPAADVEMVFMGNAVAGVVSQQEMIRGQVAFRGSELAGKPVINVENACASGGSALNLGWQAIAHAVCNPEDGWWRPPVAIGLATWIHPSVGLQLAMVLAGVEAQIDAIGHDRT